MSRWREVNDSIPEQFNLAAYFLDENIIKGRSNKVAIYYQDEQYTFNDVYTLTNRIGNVLKELGVRPEDKVSLVLRDSPEWIAACYAAEKIGGIATWAYTHLEAAGYEDFVSLVRPRVILVDETTLDKLREGVRRTRYSPILLVVGDSPVATGKNEYHLREIIRSASDKLDPEPTLRDDIAFWNFSGGTTGKSKGVPHMHQDAVFGFESLQEVVHYTENDVVVNVPKLFFHYAHFIGLDVPFRTGAAVVLFPEKTTSDLIFKLVEKYKATVLTNVPTMMRAMLQTPEAERCDLSSLRFAYASGEALSPQLYQEWMSTFGVDIVEMVGSAESYTAYLVNRPGQKVPGSVGKVAPLVKTRIVDSEGNEVPRGETGTLWVRVGSAGLGYWRDREKSLNTFLGRDWVNTNDLFREDEDGNFWYVGRADDKVKISGVFVSLLEVEGCLEKHPDVSECVVLPIPDADGLLKSKAFVALRAGVEPSETKADELKNYCKNQLAAFKAPKVVEFLSDLPKTSYGKIDRRQLKERGL